LHKPAPNIGRNPGTFLSNSKSIDFQSGPDEIFGERLIEFATRDLLVIGLREQVAAAIVAVPLVWEVFCEKLSGHPGQTFPYFTVIRKLRSKFYYNTCKKQNCQQPY
jgi:hypothetical protein